MIKDIEGIKNILVIGTGMMGHGIAQIFAVYGCEVTLTKSLNIGTIFL